MKESARGWNFEVGIIKMATREAGLSAQNA